MIDPSSTVTHRAPPFPSVASQRSKETSVSVCGVLSWEREEQRARPSPLVHTHDTNDSRLTENEGTLSPPSNTPPFPLDRQMLLMVLGRREREGVPEISEERWRVVCDVVREDASLRVLSLSLSSSSFASVIATLESLL